MQEPSGVVLASELAMELVRRKAFLAGCRQMERRGPLSELRVAALHHGAGHDGEILAARRGTAAVHASFLVA